MRAKAVYIGFGVHGRMAGVTGTRKRLFVNSYTLYGRMCHPNKKTHENKVFRAFFNGMCRIGSLALGKPCSIP